MDKYNVLTPTNNLEELEMDMYHWSLMPFQHRMRSDEECIKKYGINNRELYDKMKANILSNAIPDGTDVSVNLVKESTENNILKYNDWEERKQASDYAQRTPCIVLISPPSDSYQYTIEDLNKQYNKYNLLLPKYKIFSDQISINIWGYSVTDIYNTVIDQYFSDNNYYIKAPIDNHFHSVPIELENSLSISKVLKSLDESKETNNDTYKGLLEFKNNYADDILPSVVPYFTVSEMNDLCTYKPELCTIETFDSKEYYKGIKSLMESYNNENNTNRKLEIENTILANGWNPSVDFTLENIDYARKRQLNWLKQYTPSIIDITNINTESTILESTQQMRDLYKEKNLYPIFIVLSFSYTAFGKIIRFVKGSQYSHAGLSVDSNLKEIYTFKFGAKFSNSNGVSKKEFFDGFNKENLYDYLHNSKKAIVDILCIFVDKNTKDKIDRVLKDFISKKLKTHYNFGNILNVLFSKAKEYNYPDNMNYICSQFVDTVLKIANIDLTNKPSNLVIPQDFAEISRNPRVYKVFEGYAKDYKDKVAEQRIKALFDTNTALNIKYNDNIDFTISEQESKDNYISTAIHEKTDSSFDNSNYLKFSGDAIKEFMNLVGGH